MAGNRLYKTARWQKIRAIVLANEPLCRFCLAKGRVVPSTVADHVEPHRNDPEKFFAGPFMGLCAPCHSGLKQSIEVRGYSNEIGIDGFPIDPKHPYNAAAKDGH